MAGRICLIKSVISAIPLFYLSIFKAPEFVYKSIISIQQRFLWGWGKEKRSISWVSWEDVCKPKEEGGLGIRDIRRFNYALLAKWRWRIVSEEKGRWKDLLVSKYGMNLDRSLGPVKFQSWWWRDLQKVCTEGEGGGWFHNQLVWKVGGGEKVNFWEDVWIDNINLKSLYPRLFSLSLDQGLMVIEVGEWVGAAWRWNLRWRRDRFEWETLLETNLVQLLSRVSLLKDQKDVQMWGCDGLGSFSVNSAYDCLAKQARSLH
ncbi:uncharacterized mitochondrial protein AtMg00310-like [Phaseolus vulgaris]|uniref:uncharacterized mitochondrial protein AtMg00310-like n=1 Tax=Phaseolus vulgaris TaxID=3885 RepID=UPI0035CBAD3B